jgi:hypothetical protein
VLNWTRSNWAAHEALVAKLKAALRRAGYPGDPVEGLRSAGRRRTNAGRRAWGGPCKQRGRRPGGGRMTTPISGSRTRASADLGGGEPVADHRGACAAGGRGDREGRCRCGGRGMTGTALITGGQQGIGLGIAQALHGAGWRVALMSEREGDDQAVAEALCPNARRGSRDPRHRRDRGHRGGAGQGGSRHWSGRHACLQRGRSGHGARRPSGDERRKLRPLHVGQPPRRFLSYTGMYAADVSCARRDLSVDPRRDLCQRRDRVTRPGGILHLQGRGLDDDKGAGRAPGARRHRRVRTAPRHHPDADDRTRRRPLRRAHRRGVSCRRAAGGSLRTSAR